jgi:hypothetical protein
MIKREVYVVLFLLGIMMFSYPALNMFEGSLALYFHAAWALLILLILIVSYLQGG